MTDNFREEILLLITGLLFGLFLVVSIWFGIVAFRNGEQRLVQILLTFSIFVVAIMIMKAQNENLIREIKNDI